MKFVYILGIILLVGCILRVYNIHSVPPSPSLDEVSIGYNAYSILQTGKDEFGNSFPLLLRAYDDWRPGLYVYFVIPFIPIFGLDVISVRLPSVLMSIGILIATYILTLEFFKKFGANKARYIALVTTAILAISPWHIYISRLGHEVNLGLFTIVLGLMFFFLWNNNQNKKIYLYCCALFLGLSFYSYQSQKIITPLLIIALLVIYKNNFLTHKKDTLIAGILGIILLIPITLVSLSPQATIRFQATSVFSNLGILYNQSAINVLNAKENNDLLGQITNNRRLVIPKLLISNYASHFSLPWLFLNENANRHKVPNIGLMYLWEFPFILLGIIFLVKIKIEKRNKIFFMIWFLISPLAATITTDTPHAMRSYTFIPTWQILTSLGIVFTYIALNKSLYKKVFISVITLVILGSICYFSYMYYYIFPLTQSNSFQYGLKQSIAFVLEEQNQYNKIIISNQDNLYQSYMFFLFYTKYDPNKYLLNGGTKSGGYNETHTIEKYEFRPIVPEDFNRTSTLIIGNINELDKIPSFKSVESFSNMNGEEVIQAISL